MGGRIFWLLNFGCTLEHEVISPVEVRCKSLMPILKY